jgi:hypothetical protein
MKRRQTRPTFDDPLLRTFVGGDFVKRLTTTDDRFTVLRIGKQRWSTHDLAVQLGVVHTRAARLLTAAADAIGATSVRDLYDRSTPYTFAGVQGLGETTMYVLWRLFESQGLDPDAWANSGERDEALVSFHSLKERERKAEARTQAAAKADKRKASRTTHEKAVAAVLR